MTKIKQVEEVLDILRTMADSLTDEKGYFLSGFKEGFEEAIIVLQRTMDGEQEEAIANLEHSLRFFLKKGDSNATED